MKKQAYENIPISDHDAQWIFSLEILNLRVLEVAKGMIIDRYLALMGADSHTYNGWGVEWVAKNE